IIQSSDFLQFLNENPGVLEGLEPEVDETGEVVSGLSLEAWKEALKSRVTADPQSAAISLLPDELVEYQARRSYWYLFIKTIGPLLGMVVLPLLAFWYLNNQPVGSFAFNVQFIVTIFLMFVFALIVAFFYLDWLNDYFVITNKHLAHREFSLTSFRTNVNKIPIDQIQSVEIERPNLLANLLNFGTARITTAAQVAIVYFDNIDNPGLVQEIINELRERVRTLDAGRAQATMRQSLESHFEVQPSLHEVEDADDDEEVELIEPAEPPVLRTIWTAIRKRYQWRVEENGVITYRKHFFVLMKVTAWPVLLGVALVLLIWLLTTPFNFTTSGVLLWAGPLLLLDFAWFIWRLEDWRNDTFQLTDRYVIDIDRRPFGFGESRKQAELNNVQNISSERPGLLPTIFNYGNVIIETAGATADIVFENVSNPNRIQAEVFKRREQYRQLLRRREGEQRRKEYAVLLDVYQQATEQDRIPRRTPPDEEIEVEG
ncbi:MAG TPA: PH domain-containing protein, partial [Anaerolineae bacterium]